MRTILLVAGFSTALVVGAASTQFVHPEQAVTRCSLEDGSAPDQILPCRWDAQVSGNGRGNSFTVYRGPEGALCYRYDDPQVNRQSGGCDPA